MTFFSPVIKQNTPTNVCLTRTKQISSELVCGNPFVKILCTYFFLYIFGSVAANVPAWEHSCISESVDQIELKFCKNLLFAHSSKCKKISKELKEVFLYRRDGKKVNTTLAKKKSLRDIHEIDPQCDHVISCNIDFDLQRELTTRSATGRVDVEPKLDIT